MLNTLLCVDIRICKVQALGTLEIETLQEISYQLKTIDRPAELFSSISSSTSSSSSSSTSSTSSSSTSSSNNWLLIQLFHE